MYHEDVCAHCLRSMASPLQALPTESGYDASEYNLPFTDRFWPSVEPVACEHCNIEVRLCFCTVNLHPARSIAQVLAEMKHTSLITI